MKKLRTMHERELPEQAVNVSYLEKLCIYIHKEAMCMME